MSDAALMLRELSLPWAAGERMKTVLDRTSRLARLTYWRTFDIWYGKARRIEPHEIEQIAEALRIKKEIGSPWLSLLMDTGNFLEDPYDKLEMIAPHTSFVQAKTYYGGGEWYTLDLDYKRIIDILRKVNYQGYLSLEYEGKEDAASAVPKSIEMLRKAMR